MRSQPFPTHPGIQQSEDLRHLRLVRTRPQMSLHRLAQYVESTVSRRRNLIHYEKHPSPYRVSYAAAERLFSEALRFDWEGDRFYALALQRWTEHRLESNFAIRHRDLAVEAAAEFAAMLDSFRRNLAACGIGVTTVRDPLEPLEIGGVRVGDAPSIVLHRMEAKSDAVGVLSFHVSKSRPHDEGSARTAAVLLHALATKNDELFEAPIDPSLCVVVDVFSGLIADAGVGRKRRMKHATLACEEISSLWPTLEMRD